MDLLLKIKEFLTEAKAAGAYQGEINITILEQYAEEVFHNNYKSLEKLILPTLSVELHNNLVEKLNNISRLICQEHIPVSEAREMIEKYKRSKPYLYD